MLKVHYVVFACFSVGLLRFALVETMNSSKMILILSDCLFCIASAHLANLEVVQS